MNILQEETSTFGVLTKRLDIMDKGGLKHSRESVTTQVTLTVSFNNYVTQISSSLVQTSSFRFNPVYLYSVQFIFIKSSSFRYSPVHLNQVQFIQIQSSSFRFNPVHSDTVQFILIIVQFIQIQSSSS